MKNEKKIYESPSLELTIFNNKDLLTDSGEPFKEGDPIGMPKINF